MATPQDLFYTKSHEWVRDNGDGTVTMGITHYAQDVLGDVVYWEGPEEGTEFGAGDSLGLIESVKASSDVYSPLAGEVVASNEDLEDAPETVNSDAYGDGWLVKLKIEDTGALQNMMNAEAYDAHVATLE